MSCVVCGAAVKYRCPACGARSCSAPCVTRHKADANCTGKRPVAPYKPLLELGDDDLASDYHFLEDLLRVVGAAGRGSAKVGGSSANARDHSPARKKLRQQAEARGVRLKLLPAGMERMRDNTSRYDARTQRIRWRIELFFEAAGERHVETGVDETHSLVQLLGDVLHSDDVGQGGGRAPAARAQFDMLRYRLRSYVRAPLDTLRVSLVLQDRPANEPDRLLLRSDGTICEALKGQLVLEYPTLVVALPCQESEGRSASDTASSHLSAR